MPLFKIHTDKSFYTFDPQKSLLLDKDGNPAVRPETSKGNNGGGLAMLRIQLGLKCNYNCVYCKQADQKKKINKKTDLKVLVSKIQKEYSTIRTIFFAGGEPLLYWKEIQTLTLELRKIYPNAKIATISNGSILTKDHLQFCKENNIHFVFSHDGPGQYLRSGDPLENPDILKNIQNYLEDETRTAGIFSNGVLTPINNKPTQIVEHIRNKVGKNIRVSFEGVADLNTETVGKENLLFDNITGKELTDDILRGWVEGKLQNTVFEERIHDFLRRLAHQANSHTQTQKCGQLRDDVVAVDLQGNTMICHSSTSKENYLGKIDGYQKAKPDQFLWSKRETCSNCIVQQLCGGGCLLSPYGSEEQKTTCKNDFYYHMGIFAATIFEITKDFITKIEIIKES